MALGGVGYYAQGYFNSEYWNLNYWAGAGSGPPPTPGTLGTISKLPAFPRISRSNATWTKQQQQDIKAIWDDLFRSVNSTGAVAGAAVTMFSGTVDPDQRPTGLGAADADGVLFYATDYDHLLRWTGTAWLAVDYDADEVVWRRTAPTTNGWVLCNGVGTTKVMLPDGTLSAAFSVPDLTHGAYVKGGTSYSGPTTTAAVAPGLTGAPGGTISEITPTGTISEITPDGTISQITPAGTISGSGTIGGFLNLVDHIHGLTTLTTTSGNNNQHHQHDTDGGSSTITIGIVAPSNNNYNQTGTGVAVYSVSASIGGLTDIEDTPHDHDVDFTTFFTDVPDSGPVAMDISNLTVSLSGVTFTGTPVTPTFTGTPVTPTFDGDPVTPTFTGDIGTLAVDATAQPLHMTLLPYLRL